MVFYNYKPILRKNGIVLGRFLLALLFVYSGVNMLLGGISNTTGYFDSIGIPMAGIAALLVIAVHIGGGICLMLGVKTEEAALTLLVFTVLTILFVHRDTTDMHLWKNLSIIGGLFYVMAYGAGDGWRLNMQSDKSTS